MVAEHVGVGEESVGLGLAEQSVEAFFVVLTASARLDFDHFGGVSAVIEAVTHAVHPTKPASVDLPQVHELLLEALPACTRTLSLATPRKSKPSIYNLLSPTTQSSHFPRFLPHSLPLSKVINHRASGKHHL